MKCPSEFVAPVLVVDTGPLIALTKVSLLSLLPSLFGCICIPQAVADELQLDSERPDAIALKTFMQQNPVLQVQQASVVSSRLSDLLDAGEAEAIALAVERKGALLINERRGRAVAIHWKVLILGTAAVVAGRD